MGAVDGSIDRGTGQLKRIVRLRHRDGGCLSEDFVLHSHAGYETLLRVVHATVLASARDSLNCIREPASIAPRKFAGSALQLGRSLRGACCSPSTGVRTRRGNALHLPVCFSLFLFIACLFLRFNIREWTLLVPVNEPFRLI